MKDAFQLLDEYNAKKTAKVPLSKELAPLFGQLANLLERIAEKELPEPKISVESPEVNVTVDAPKSPEIKIPEIKIPKPIINNESYDYTSLFIELKRSVDKLAQIVENRPQIWEVERNNRGFIEKVKGVSSE